MHFLLEKIEQKMTRRLCKYKQLTKHVDATVLYYPSSSEEEILEIVFFNFHLNQLFLMNP